MVPTAGNDRLYQVVFDLPGGVRTIEIGGEEFILDAARRAGVELPSL